jgi:ATP-dependent helicase/nuclease subunit B
MTGIEKIDPFVGDAALPLTDHPVALLWTDQERGLMNRLRVTMQRRDAHPHRTVVLLPYAQLLPWAVRWWGQCFPDGFAPRFETTMNWCAAQSKFTLSPTDIAFDSALDVLTAGSLLERAGLGAQRDMLAARLVQAAHQLAPIAAAHSPSDRQAWGHAMRAELRQAMQAPALALEAAVGQIALVWVAGACYPTDALFTASDASDAVQSLVFVQGIVPDPLALALQPVWGERLVIMDLLWPIAGDMEQPLLHVPSSAIAWHACADAQDEAQRSTACVIQHLQAGRAPVALVSTDRALTRRVQAMLAGSKVRIRDENGWKLSTGHWAARVMALLRAAAWSASTDDVLDWLKLAPVFVGVDALEAGLRYEQLRDWRRVADSALVKGQPALQDLVLEVNRIRESLQGKHNLSQWLLQLGGALHRVGEWQPMLADGAGVKVLEVLRLCLSDRSAWEQWLNHAPWAAQRMDQSEFTAWVNHALEAASYSEPYPLQEQVVILPMNQMLGRPFAAVVLAGCDEVRLTPTPEPPGHWAPWQRKLLGLPSRELLQAMMLGAWQHALQTPVCDVVWRSCDDSGETLLPSALVQTLRLLLKTEQSAQDPRGIRWIEATPIAMPRPTAACLAPNHLSASAYDDLRQCPYRFFALRQLGLRSDDELDGVVDKRDFGLWLHEVLKRFHETLATAGETDSAHWPDALEASADAATLAMGLADGDFLPFAAAWPAVREGYLAWFMQHQTGGATFVSAETSHRQAVGDISLVGRIDRIDRLADGTVLLVDYKTESADKTRSRVKEPLEDTQMSFYAALLPQDTLQAAYVNVGERDGTRAYPQPDIVQARDALVQGILQDMQAIVDDAPLPALGDGVACDFCNARGLCRKDFWSVT